MVAQRGLDDRFWGARCIGGDLWDDCHVQISGWLRTIAPSVKAQSSDHSSFSSSCPPLQHIPRPVDLNFLSYYIEISYVKISSQTVVTVRNTKSNRTIFF